MKLISLNIWGGQAYDPLVKFIKENSRDTDIFCFQEVFSSNSGITESRGSRINIFGDLISILGDFHPYFTPEGDGYDNIGPVDIDLSLGQATFVKKTTAPQIDSEGCVFVYRERMRLKDGDDPHDLPANFAYTRFVVGDKKFTVCNLHGIPRPGHKKDTESRIRQSEIIKEFISGETGAKIICGDFNLMPETQSIKIIEDAGMKNLIKEFKIKRTRSKISPFFGKEDFQKFADYTFVSPDINVLNFGVPDVAVSDHLPLVLEFS